jgi:glycosyltransferase involved in cell wall biosynthesis
VRQPLVSAVVPAYNAARTLRAAVESILLQTVVDMEVIVVDDGSEDETAEVARAIADPRVRLISQPNLGASAARNAGIHSARGRYVAFLDADDLWLPDKLARQLALLDSRRDVHAVHCGAIYVDDELRVLSVRRCRPWRDALLDVLHFENLSAFPSTLVAKREKLEQRGFDPSLVMHEDWDMAIHAARHWHLQPVEEPLALYRVHRANRSRDVEKHLASGLRIIERVFADASLPARIQSRRRAVHARYYTMLAAAALKYGQWRQGAHWAVTAIGIHPVACAYMARLALWHAGRRLSGERRQRVPDQVRLLASAIRSEDAEWRSRAWPERKVTAARPRRPTEPGPGGEYRTPRRPSSRAPCRRSR